MFKKIITLLVVTQAFYLSLIAHAQPTARQTTAVVENIRWKSESAVRDLLGEPNNVLGPVGTHAAYTLWKYDDFTVAFANQRALHLFNKNSLQKRKVE